MFVRLRPTKIFLLSLSLFASIKALRYDINEVGYNLNENQTAVEPKDYWGLWENHKFQPSPSNWRFPYYVLTLDRFVDGDPTNNEANGTVFEHDWMSNQFRFGGDVAGVLANLDYIQDLGTKTIYFTGSMMINMPWSPDGYGPLDLTLLDRHHGDIEEWRILINEIHDRGMYVIFDNTMATMGDLLGYGKPYTNATVGFSFDEYDYIWKEPSRHYHDFQPSNAWDPDCKPPQIWEQNGYLAQQDVIDNFHGCRDSEYQMYGDIKGTGAYPSYINQLSRFGSVQDRLREWRPDVLEKINVMSCMQIQMLDLDGFRMDKAVQTTLDAMAEFSDYQRRCAKRLGKDNFLVVGEVVANPKLGANYYGRGMRPDQAFDIASEAISTSNLSDSDRYIRPWGMSALDGAAFHYDIYGSMTRFLGLDGPWGSLGVDWVEIWNHMLKTQDLVNANTGLFDPRHLYGTTNQDVFRWPALANGAQRQLLGFFVATLELPGAPMVIYGEEQEFYILENAAPDYVYGRMPMASQRAWQLHGCYNLGEEVYVDMPFNSSTHGCHDDSVSRDHRDPSHAMRNIFKRFFELREHYPTLNDGYNLTTLSTHTYDIFLRGSQGMPSPTGLWSVFRGRNDQSQDFTGQGYGNQPVWLLYHNENRTVTYNFDCSSTNSTSLDGALISAFATSTTVRNLLYPYEIHTLEPSTFALGLENETGQNGCLSEITLPPWGFKAFVPEQNWRAPNPVITKVVPGHDTRLLSQVKYDELDTVRLEIHFSEEMSCQSVIDSLRIESTTEVRQLAFVNTSSVLCETVEALDTPFVAQVPATWIFTATLENVGHGVHTYTVRNASTASGVASTNTNAKFMFRIGGVDNPMVFPESANHTKGLLQQDENSRELFVVPKAAGADLVRYSTNWGSSYSSWQPYQGGKMTVTKQSWSGSKRQEWDGEHIILNYWSNITGSSDHFQHSDLAREDDPPRRWPHAFVEGIFNQWGYDSGVSNSMKQNNKGEWIFDLFTEWPTNVVVNVWGMNPDGRPDKSATYGDVDRDGVLDWVWPNSIANNFVNISALPSNSRLGYRLVVNDGNYSYSLRPYGSQAVQLVVIILICILPALTGIMGVKIFQGAFYKVKYNKIGLESKTGWLPWQIWLASILQFGISSKNHRSGKQAMSAAAESGVAEHDTEISILPETFAAAAASPHRQTVLIATIEYEIQDYNVKIKIGGLGVMSSLMGKSLENHNLIWVVPCVGGVDYPFETDSLSVPINVTMMDQQYLVTTHVHILNNVTYVLLDSPIFRKRTKAEPYPARMDDLESGFYYSAWNQCIAEVCRRYHPDIYHINDYHGACAPLYLLPEVVPACMSLHNAEFQGMWPLKTKDQMAEMSRVFNLSPQVIKRYIQFGEVFNLLHAGASYLRVHQGGFGAVGVSEKYAKRSLVRYPALWGLHSIGSLPNPDPTDTAPVDKGAKIAKVEVNTTMEEERLEMRRQAQEWAGLNVDPRAELFIFVGRWSMQKGIDLIADVFPAVLEKHSTAQLICVGPVIDLYGRFAALKLAKLTNRYPGRVCSKPEFTALPPYLFSGAEFALMPSRDEPFGLVAVEFGRKGALCVGARVGGFGNMPGWWFTVEAMTPKHLVTQFMHAISAALASDYETRASMRAYSLLQRFPVAQWVEDLQILHKKSINASVTGKTKAETMKKWAPFGHSTTSLASASTMTNNYPVPPWEAVDPWSTPSIASPVTSAMASRAPSIRGYCSPTALGSNIDIGSPRAYHDVPGIDSVGSSTPVGPYGHTAFDATMLHDSLSKAIQNRPAIERGGAITPTFNDSKNTYYDRYSQKLDKKLNAKASYNSLSIEKYIVDSEKEWFKGYHLASLRKHPVHASSRLASNASDHNLALDGDASIEGSTVADGVEEYDELFGNDYVAPTGIRKILAMKIGPWYLYCYLLALGQIMSASSYQLTLLTGQIGEPENKLYIICAIYFASSVLWWILYRTTKAIYSLSAPFVGFGCCFLLLALSRAASGSVTRGWIFDVASAAYAASSSAGFLFFSLNFGTEGGTPSQVWTFRACAIAGTQNILIAFLWYWGSYLTHSSGDPGYTPSSTALTAVTVPLGIVMFAIAASLFRGLPDYYRQEPGAVPFFYRALLRRGIVLWFWIMVVLQNFWLSASYNRNWLFLWSSQRAPRWAVALLVVLFFIVMWTAALTTLAHQSKQHPWIVPILAIGLGAPRWCQMLWSLSGIGHHIPWAGVVGGALVSRSVWLWLGVLDAVQGIGFGMMLLMTLARLHVSFTLVVAQAVGAIFTILSRLSAPDKINNSSAFINLASDSLASFWFWAALICQLIICAGFFTIFRKAQLMKP